MKLLHIFLMICTAAAWGYTFTATRVALEVFTPEQMAFARAAVTLIVLLPWWKPTQAVPLKFLAASLAIGAVAYYLFYTAIRMTESLTTVAIVTQLMAPISALVAFVFYREQIGTRKWFGIALATLGAVYLAASGTSVLSVAALGITVLAVTFYSSGSVVAAKSSSVGVWRMLAWISATAIIPTALMAGSSGPLWPDLALLETRHWLAIVFTFIVSALLGQAVLFSLYRLYSISEVVPYVLLTPLFAGLFAVLVYNEPIELSLWLGGTVVLLGVWIQQTGTSRRGERAGISSGYSD
jgi:O-acetylserine/cysteine efflux transporter